MASYRKYTLSCKLNFKKQNTPSEAIRSVPAADRDAAVALVDAELLLEPLGARAAGVATGRV